MYLQVHILDGCNLTAIKVNLYTNVGVYLCMYKLQHAWDVRPSSALRAYLYISAFGIDVQIKYICTLFRYMYINVHIYIGYYKAYNIQRLICKAAYLRISANMVSQHYQEVCDIYIHKSIFSSIYIPVITSSSCVESQQRPLSYKVRRDLFLRPFFKNWKC